jgi:hypothetical protein
MGAVIMLGTLGGLIIMIFALVLRHDPQMRSSRTRSCLAQGKLQPVRGFDDVGP